MTFSGSWLKYDLLLLIVAILEGHRLHFPESC